MAFDSFVSGFSRISPDLNEALLDVFKDIQGGKIPRSNVASLLRYSQVVMPSPEKAFDWVLDLLIEHLSTQDPSKRSRGKPAAFVSPFEPGALKQFSLSSETASRSAGSAEIAFEESIGVEVEYSLSVDRIFNTLSALHHFAVPSFRLFKIFGFLLSDMSLRARCAGLMWAIVGGT